MSAKGNKFGTFKGVFTPSILSILGVIMYLRLPWIVGQAGLIATLGIILVAHIISVSTGLSIASIATDKRVETGGPYYMISRSLGLAIGGTLGLALFVGLSLSVSLYLIGFSEVFLTAMGLEASLNNIRFIGAITLIALSTLTFISTSLALKTQFIILAVVVLSLASIFLGRHEFSPSEPLLGAATNALPWIALFAIFFPAVTGFTAGVSMSGDLRDPKKSIPVGTIAAIFAGLIVYVALSIFLSHSTNRSVLQDPGVLGQISFYYPLVVAGIWGATLSSATGSIMGAPRILQATAIDRITPKIFAKGVGAGSEPRNALFLTFLIAFAGIMIGDLNAIARIITIFFIITYGFLNLTCAIESIVGSDFRPSFRVPSWVGFIGAITCFFVMILLDLIVMLGATAILGAIFLLLKRKELTLQAGDTWGGIWSSLVKTGLFKLSDKTLVDKRNWRPNVILFSGSASARPHLISMAQTMVGKLGVFTNFELLEDKSEKQLFLKAGDALTTTDCEGKKVFTRRHVCKDIYQGISSISSVYGFTGFEPNTVLLGWGKRTKAPEKFTALIEHLHQLDYNLAFLNYNKERGFGRKKQIDLWWNQGSSNLNFGITLLKFISSDPNWSRARIRIFFVSHDSNTSEMVHTIIRQVLDDQRMDAIIKLIENSIEKKTLAELVKAHSQETDLSILDFELGASKPGIKSFNTLTQISESAGTSLIIRAGSIFDPIRITGADTLALGVESTQTNEEIPSLAEQLPYPNKEILANELFSLASHFDELHKKHVLKSWSNMSLTLKNTLGSLSELNEWAITSMEKILKEKEEFTRSKQLTKLYSDYLFQADRFVSTCEKELLPSLKDHFNKASNTYLRDANIRLEKVPEKVSVKYAWPEFEVKENDRLLTRLTKLRKRLFSKLLNKQVRIKIPLRKLTTLFLITKRKQLNYELFQKTGITSFTFFSAIRRNLSETNEIIQNQINIAGDLVSANLSLKLGREKLQEINSQMMEQIGSHISDLTGHAGNELRSSFKKIAYMLGNPESDTGIRHYEKAFSTTNLDISNPEELHEVLEKNLGLYINKILTEYKLLSLKARLRSKLSKHMEDLEIMLENRIKKPLRKIKETALLLSNEKNSLQSKSFLNELKNQQAFDLGIIFERFFMDIQKIIAEMPEEIELAHPEFIHRIEAGDFSESNAELVELKKQTNLFIGRDMTNKLRIELDNTEESLNAILKNIKDIIRLAVFNLENAENAVDRETASSQHDVRSNLINELILRIDKEQNKANEVFQQAIANMNALLNTSFEPLGKRIFLMPDQKDVQVSQTKSRIMREISLLTHSIKHFLRNQWVRIIYTRSEGMLIVKRLSQFEKDGKFSNQAVYEMIQTLAPNPEVAKKIPFYYANLFAGNSTINKDLWVGMEKQIREAEAALEQFKLRYGGALLITGERNSGKSSLSRLIARDLSTDNKGFLIRAPKEGSVRIHDLHQAFRQSMNSTLDPNYLLDIQPSQQVFVFNDLELWWERTPEGSAAIEEIFRMIDKYGKKHLFIINCRTWAYNFLNQFYKLDNKLLAHIECDPFDARELKEMIMLRHNAGGLKFRLNKKDEETFSEYDYAQLFNRYFTLSGGNPGYTIRTWINSISNISGKRLEIRLPELPDTSKLTELNQEIYMVIVQFVLHRRLTVKKLAAILRQPEKYASALLSDMRRAGLLDEKFPGVYALNLLLEPFLVEQLRKKNLL